MIENLKTSGFTETQKQAFADLVRSSMGSMTIVEFSSISGLSVSFVSKALNKALLSKPSQRSLEKLVKATPGGGPSIEEYYKACGLDTTILKNRRAIPETKKMPLQEAVWTYYSPAVMGIDTFLSAWMAHNNDSDIDLRLFQGGNVFTMKKRGDDFAAVVATVFCQDDNGITALKSIVPNQMLMALGVADKENLHAPTYYFLTDRSPLFEFCANDLPKLPSQNVVVLLANENHSGFSKQALRLADGCTAEQLPNLL